MASTKRNRHIGLAIVLSLVLAALWAVSTFVFDIPGYFADLADPNGLLDSTSDRAMIHYFDQHQAQFNALLDGYTQDELDALGLLDPAENSWFGPGTYFDRFSKGWLGGSSDKGYIHSEEPLTPLVRDTDAATHELVFHEIGNYWYVFAYVDP
jgi:hypothetical protein